MLSKMLTNSILSRPALKKEVKSLTRLAGPIFISQICTSILGVTDSLMAGGVGTVDLGAIALGVSFWMPISLFCFGIAFSLSPITAHLWGASKYHKIAPLSFNAIYPSLIAVILGMFALQILPEILLNSIDPLLAQKAANYLFWMSYALPALQLFYIIKSTIEGVSIAVPGMVIGIITCILNIPMNWICTYGKFGMPEMGAPGCGLATAIVSWFSLLCIIFYCKRSKKLNKLNISIWNHFHKPNRSDISQICRVGLPISGAAIIETCIFALMSYALARFGSATVAASQIASTVYTMAFMIPLSMSNATSIRVGQCLGRGSIPLAKLASLSGFIVSAVIVIPFMFLIYMNRYTIISWFSSDPEVVAIAAPLFLFVLGYQTQDPFFGTAQGILRGFKDTRTMLVFNILILWGIAVPLGYLVGITDTFGKAFGVQGIWAVVVSSYYLMTIAFLFRDVWLFKHGKRYLHAKDSN